MSPRFVPIGFVLLVGACNQDFNVNKDKAELALSPALADLGDVTLGSEQSFNLRVDSISGGDAQILSVEIVNNEGDFFTYAGEAPVTVPTGGNITLPFLYAPTELGWHDAVITLVSDAVDPVVGRARGHAVEACGSVSPLIIDFGPVGPGDTGTREVQVTNCGDLDFQLTAADITGTVFTFVETLPYLVSAGLQANLELAFNPTRPAPASETLQFQSDPVIEGLVAVTLRGNDCESGSAEVYDQDGDGYSSCGGDCDDEDVGTRPGGVEVADGIDNDCDGIIDEGTEAYDDDGDGYTEIGGDCNDADPLVNPAAAEIWDNGIDDNCDGVVDSGEIDLDADGYSVQGGDCDDANRQIHPGAVELADGIDNDCDGIADEGTTWFDDDRDGFTELAGDCDDTDPTVYPAAPEQEDGADNDCDGSVDEGTRRADDDGDGFTENGGDCNDANAAISPAAQEVADGIDNNCDGVIL